MADIRIKDLATTATTTASDDFMAVDGVTNGTRKLSAATPAFLTSVTTPSLTAPASTNLTLTSGLVGTNRVNFPDTLSASSATAGAVTIGNGTAATNVAIGGGKVNIGDTTAGASNAGALVVAGGISAGNTGSAASYFGGAVTVIGVAENISAQFGSSTSSQIYIRDNTINCASGNNGAETLRFNYVGYNNGTTQFRNSVFHDGKAAVVATFTGSDKSATFAGAVTVGGTGTEISGAGYLRATSGFSKTDTSLRNIAALSTNEAAGSSYKLLFSVTGDATAASRVFDVQTSNEGVSNSGVLRLQNLGGSVSVGGAATFAGAVSGAAATFRPASDGVGLTLNQANSASAGWSLSPLNSGSLTVTRIGGVIAMTCDLNGNTAFNTSTTQTFGAVVISSGNTLKLGNAYVAGAVVGTGSITIQDSTGNTYRIPVLV